jgi:hypothetical protein
MREELARLNMEKRRFRARIDRRGRKTTWRDRAETILLLHVIDVASGRMVADHLWFRHGKWCAGLSKGSTIEFSGRVRPYFKGYQGDREGSDSHSPFGIDYGIGRPRMVTIVTPIAVKSPASAGNGN